MFCPIPKKKSQIYIEHALFIYSNNKNSLNTHQGWWQCWKYNVNGKRQRHPPQELLEEMRVDQIHTAGTQGLVSHEGEGLGCCARGGGAGLWAVRL